MHAQVRLRRKHGCECSHGLRGHGLIQIRLHAGFELSLGGLSRSCHNFIVLPRLYFHLIVFIVANEAVAAWRHRWW